MDNVSYRLTDGSNLEDEIIDNHLREILYNAVDKISPEDKEIVDQFYKGGLINQNDFDSIVEKLKKVI